MYEFTAPFQNPSGSPIRELFKYLGEPGMISFAGGYPASDLFDADGLQPADPATLQALRLQQAKIVTAPVDAHGLDVARLATLLASGTFARPKLLYTVPTFANPTGATITRERRIALLKLAVQYRFLIVEDDPYGDLRYSGVAVPSIISLAAEVE